MDNPVLAQEDKAAAVPLTLPEEAKPPGAPEEDADVDGGCKAHKKKKKRKPKSQGGASTSGSKNVSIMHSKEAGRDLRRGETVFEELPVTLILFREYSSRYCVMCGKAVTPETLSTQCDALDGIVCSNACLKRAAIMLEIAGDAWSHVGPISQAEGLDAYLCRMVLRLLCERELLRRQQEQAQSGGGGGGGGPLEQQQDAASILQPLTGDVDGLMDHKEHMEPAFLEQLDAVWGRLIRQHLQPHAFVVKPEEATRLACVMNVNSHGISSPCANGVMIGCGLFPLLAQLNHSCRPNCVFAFEGGVMRVKVIEDVKAGQELTVAYVNMLTSRDRRRQQLLETKHFFCRCTRCTRHEGGDVLLAGVCCARCGEKGLLQSGEEAAQVALAAKAQEQALCGGAAGPETDGIDHQASSGGGSSSDWSCGCCGKSYGAAEVQEYLNLVERHTSRAMELVATKGHQVAREHLEAVLALHDVSKPLPKGQLKGQHLRLHPNHYTLLNSVLTLVNCCIRTQADMTAVAHLRRMISACESVFPPFYPELADYHQALGDGLRRFTGSSGSVPKKTLGAMKAEMKAAYQRAFEIRNVALGAMHPLTLESHSALQELGA